MFRKLIAAAIVMACAFAMMPISTYAAPQHRTAQARAAFEAKTNVVIGTQTRTGRISYAIKFDIGQNATLIEIAPAGTEVWTTFVNIDQIDAMVLSGRVGYFSQVIYNTNTFDFRVNGVVWRNVEVANDRFITLGYDYEPIVVSVQDFSRVTKE
jgi:hypothetical protein